MHENPSQLDVANDTIERLVIALARATGVPETVVRINYPGAQA